MLKPMTKTAELKDHPATHTRSSIRLSSELIAAIDATRRRRPGKISRNTWITEAVEEKLAREGAGSRPGEKPDG
jgi:hypothetical protein